MNTFSIDIHCHPSLRPYSKSFAEDPSGQNTTNRKKKNSIWYYDPPRFGDKLAQRIAGFTKFSQSNLSALAYGNVRCICASFYPLERGFVRLKTGDGAASDFIANLISSFGKERIDFVQSNKDYFNDLQNEYKFYTQINSQEITFSDGKRKYVLIKSFNHLENEMAINEENDVETIYIIITIEGMHVLGTGIGDVPDENVVLANLKTIKDWEFRPFFVTFAHHFYNDLCGHAESMSDFLQDLLTNQEPGMDEGFTPLGWKVLKQLIDNTGGKRIHIDVKHMSYLARKEYFNYLKTEQAAEYSMKKLPIIISHGACNGKKSEEDPNPTQGLELTASRMYDADINFYDEEIVEMAKSGGIIGLQLDERRIASKQYKRTLRLASPSAERRQHSNSKMLWNNIQHIAQLLDKHDLFAWDCMAIGSDFDGVIDPINMFWTSENMDDLIQYTERHAHNFLNDQQTIFKNSSNKIDAAEIIGRIFHYNAYEFFRKHFK